jgi:hypothetical protein
MSLDNAHIWLPAASRSRSSKLGKLVSLFYAFSIHYLVIKLLKRRLPPPNVTGNIFSLKPFRTASYSVFCISGFVTYLGIYTCKSSLDTMLPP